MPDDVRQVAAPSLLAADDIRGTAVFDANGGKLGTVDHVMLDKVSGQAIYAVISFGGFLGIGQRYHPLPWSTLRYAGHAGGYVVDLDSARLKTAPSFDGVGEFRWTAEYSRMVDRYYGAPLYWL